MSTLERQTMRATRQALSASRLWGLDVRGLHDRWWASLGVQVVRLGQDEPVQSRGPALHLLLERDDLVVFRLNQVIRQLQWLKPRAVRVRIADASSQPYVERVVADDDDNFIAIERQYRPRTRMTRRAWITPDARLASVWCEHASRKAARRAIDEAGGRNRLGAISVRGRVFDAEDPRQTDACLDELLSTWRWPGEALAGVREHLPGVWMHETAEASPKARLIPPIWAGAAARFGPDDVVIGPRVVWDATPPPSAPPIDWSARRTSGWRLTPRRRRGRRAIKRLFDIGFSLCVIAATLPLYPLLIAAILIEDGWPPFFAHHRQTLRGREFPCLKFRTMRRDAEQMKQRLIEENVCDGPQFYIEDDPRLLRVGRFMRRFQLDELPQFFNVLLGQMSVVGPRPSPEKENQYCPAWREARLSVRPGVTGLWQIRRTREPETDFQEWIQYDVEYVRRASLRLDLWIIAQTVLKMFR